MSAFLVSENHINALVSTAIHGVVECEGNSQPWYHVYFDRVHVQQLNADNVGLKLWQECAASVSARYPKDPETISEYHFTAPARRLSAVAALKLIRCYEYQSCEHDGWESSASKQFCAGLTSAIIEHLSGYQCAPWGID
jgi:hypothetical protein